MLAAVDITGFILLSFLCHRLFKAERGLRPVIIFLSFSYLWVALSNVVLGYEFYITEQHVESHRNGSVVIFFLYTSISLVTLLFGYQLARKIFPRLESASQASYILSEKKYSRFIARAFLLLSIILTIALSIFIIKSGSPLLDGDPAARFTIWEKINSPIVELLSNQIILLSFAAAALHKERKLFLIFLFAAISYQALLGQKFSAILLTIWLFSYFVLIDYNLKIKPKHFIFTAAAALIFILISAASYTAEGRGDFNDSLNFAFYRAFVLQGHMWWGSVEYINSTTPNYQLLLTPNVDFMTQLMYMLSPFSIAYTYIESGVRFTMGYPAILHASLGFMGVFAAIAVSLTAGFFFFIINASRKFGFLIFLLFTKAFIEISVFLTMGSQEKLFSLQVLGTFFSGVFALYILSSRKEKRNGRNLHSNTTLQ